MAKSIIIDGREFAIGDVVLVDHFNGSVVPGKICSLRDGDFHFRIGVRITSGHPMLGNPALLWCEPEEIHSIRENFA